MGLDRFANFISKSINNDGIDDINLENNIRQIISNHIIFDLNFLIYQEIIEIENEINDIIKIILCLPFSTHNYKILEKLLQNIFTQEHWKPYYAGTQLENIFDGFNEDEIITKFLKYITTKIVSKLNLDDGLSIIELVIYEKIINMMTNYINQLHYPSFIQTLSIFFDGIPSVSKIIEQRRRRIKNFLESNEKKILFKKYFDNLLPNNKKLFENLSGNCHKNISDLELKNLIFDYFKWVSNRFSIDKSIGPSSNFIKKLELFMNIKIKNNFPKIKVVINSAQENGESDLKIFKYISDNDETLSGDFCIHTTDSDLIHQILVQQTYYKILNKDINLSLVKYLKNFNYMGYAQIFEGNLIIKNILDLYNTVNNTKTNNYKIIWDICLIFFLFGNDHLPSSLEIGPELGLEFYLKKHYQSLNKLNIVNLKKSYITLDLNNLIVYFEKINETNAQNITKIILQRFFKINSYLLNIIVDKLNLDFNKLLEFLKKFIIIRALQLPEEEYNKLDSEDLRKLLTVNLENPDNYKNYEVLGFDEIRTKLIIDSIQLIEDNICYSEKEYFGLILYNKPHNITNDPYQDLYNYISEKANQKISKQFPDLYDYIDLTVHLKNLLLIDTNSEPNDYLKKVYHLAITQFGNMKDYHSDNLTFYKYYMVPSIDKLIKYLKISPDTYTKVWFKEINDDNIDLSQYFNSSNHYLLITPFILNYTLPKDNQQIIQELEPIENLWLNSIESFNYRNINIRNFFKKWTEATTRINLNNTSNELIHVNLDFI
jgi:hypothetical protein